MIVPVALWQNMNATSEAAFPYSITMAVGGRRQGSTQALLIRMLQGYSKEHRYKFSITSV